MSDFFAKHKLALSVLAMVICLATYVSMSQSPIETLAEDSANKAVDVSKVNEFKEKILTTDTDGLSYSQKADLISADDKSTPQQIKQKQVELAINEIDKLLQSAQPEQPQAPLESGDSTDIQKLIEETDAFVSNTNKTFGIDTTVPSINAYSTEVTELDEKQQLLEQQLQDINQTFTE